MGDPIRAGRPGQCKPEHRRAFIAVGTAVQQQVHFPRKQGTVVRCAGLDTNHAAVARFHHRHVFVAGQGQAYGAASELGEPGDDGFDGEFILGAKATTDHGRNRANYCAGQTQGMGNRGLDTEHPLC